jgi:ribonucleoside-diphosphate reductase alpha chain
MEQSANAPDMALFTMEVSRRVWEAKYRAAGETRVTHTWQRVAHAVAAAEAAEHAVYWETAFYQLLEDFRFLPGGRILAGAGTGHRVTLFNCFVMGLVPDDLAGIFESLKEGALTMQRGGGVGYDFSCLRPAGTVASSTGSIASGPVSFMHVWDAMCATMLSTGARRGAMMATLRCDHPDVEAFIEAKRDPWALRHFNLSVQVSDEFMAAVEEDRDWALVFPVMSDHPVPGPLVRRRWSGTEGPVDCAVVRTVRARDLWEMLMRAAYDTAEPGVLFVDRINAENNLHWRERLTATNPCGEIPLPPYGACNLGSLNLAAFVERPFRRDARLDLDGLAAAARLAVRFLDDVVDVSEYPLPAQAEQARATRRLGLGVTGLADALAMLGVEYDSAAGRAEAALALETIRNAAYRASVALAAEKGSFPAFEARPFLGSRFVARLPEDIRDAIRRQGIRNSHLLAIAPAGTISLLANNVSSGIEPIFSLAAERQVLTPSGSYATHTVEDHAWALWQRHRPGMPPTAAFLEAAAISPSAHLEMQAALQPFVDNAISKTINVAEDLPFAEFADLYRQAWRAGLKGCTVFRPNPVTGAILRAVAEPSHCCSLEREAD